MGYGQPSLLGQAIFNVVVFALVQLSFLVEDGALIVIDKTPVNSFFTLGLNGIWQEFCFIPTRVNYPHARGQIKKVGMPAGG